MSEVLSVEARLLAWPSSRVAVQSLMMTRTARGRSRKRLHRLGKGDDDGDAGERHERRWSWEDKVGFSRQENNARRGYSCKRSDVCHGLTPSKTSRHREDVTRVESVKAEEESWTCQFSLRIRMEVELAVRRKRAASLSMTSCFGRDRVPKVDCR